MLVVHIFMFALDFSLLLFKPPAAVTTFNEDDITLAIKHLSFAETLAGAQLHASKPSFTSNFTKLFSGRKHFMANGQLRSMVIKAESVLLIALIQLFQESLISYGKAALNLRRGNCKFTLLSKCLLACLFPENI